MMRDDGTLAERVDVLHLVCKRENLLCTTLRLRGGDCVVRLRASCFRRSSKAGLTG